MGDATVVLRRMVGLTQEQAEALSRLEPHRLCDDPHSGAGDGDWPEPAEPERDGAAGADARRIEIPPVDWTDALADALAQARDGDTIVVRSAALAEVAERARRRMRPDLVARIEVAPHRP